MAQRARCLHITARLIHTGNPCLSYVGRAAIEVPSSVTIVLPRRKQQFDTNLSKAALRHLYSRPSGDFLVIQGPRGQLKMPLPPYLTVNLPQDLNAPSPPSSTTAADASSPDTVYKVTVACSDPSDRKQRSMWGTTRGVLQNHVVGVSEGHVSTLTFIGVGYRANLEQDDKYLALRVGYANPVLMEIPSGIKVKCQTPVRVIVEGNDLQQVGEFCASVRKHRKPEPYKGKGIFVNDETILRKEPKRK